MDLDKLEVSSCGSLMKFNKDKCKDLNLGMSNPMQQWNFGATYPESNFTEKDLWVQVENK